ncbi:MAG: LysR substrate-binding domain-containing protein [Xanthomonadaceae bacterium]|jgi:DNA-binding transcriptional LysR family regulator|nr:LysR substrate-binding domain-containing protein [Xanthomonadaceae bacterium]
MPIPHRPVLDLDCLHAFLVLAEELGFGRAAERLAITQPALSRKIKALETDLGTPLFVRDHHRCALTAAGAALRPGAERLLHEADLLARHAAQAARGTAGTVRLGCLSLLTAGLLPRLLETLHARHPQLDVVLVDAGPGEQWQAIRDGRLDAGVVGMLPESAAHDLDLHELLQVPLVVALPPRHPLLARRRLQWTDLAAPPLVVVGARHSPRYAAWLRERFAAAGVAHGPMREVDRAQTLLQCIAGGLGVAVLPAPVAQVAHPGIAWRPLAAVDTPYRVMFAWRRGEPAPAVRTVFDLLRDIAAQAATPRTRARRAR